MQGVTGAGLPNGGVPEANFNLIHQLVHEQRLDIVLLIMWLTEENWNSHG